MNDPTSILQSQGSARALQSDGRVHGVVAGCRGEDGRWLCIRRGRRVAAPLKVCFPGGGIEAGESQPTALIREMREELGAEVRPIARVWHWEKPDGRLVLWGWTAQLLSASLRPDPQEVAEILWLTSRQAVEHPDAMPTNRLFVAQLEPPQTFDSSK
jgi:8-oxo-dGTP diphosphatase